MNIHTDTDDFAAFTRHAARTDRDCVKHILD